MGLTDFKAVLRSAARRELIRRKEGSSPNQRDPFPSWGMAYLESWTRRRPDGRPMTVTYAAEQAGVKPVTIRQWRRRSHVFRRLEELYRWVWRYYIFNTRVILHNEEGR